MQMWPSCKRCWVANVPELISIRSWEELEIQIRVWLFPKNARCWIEEWKVCKRKGGDTYVLTKETFHQNFRSIFFSFSFLSFSCSCCHFARFLFPSSFPCEMNAMRWDEMFSSSDKSCNAKQRSHHKLHFSWLDISFYNLTNPAVIKQTTSEKWETNQKRRKRRRTLRLAKWPRGRGRRAQPQQSKSLRFSPPPNVNWGY